MYDLIIIGGGPAGTAAAITAARGGAQVLLLEQGRLPRHKVCGEFVSAESLALLQSLLPSRSRLIQEAPCISEARIFLDGRQLRAQIAPPAASISRFNLDYALWSAAAAAGAETRLQTPVRRVSGEGPFRVETARGVCYARALINTSGRWSTLASAPLARARHKWLGLKAHFREPSPAGSVDLYFFAGGYCGVQPVAPALINVSAMVRSDSAASLPAVFALHPRLRARSAAWLAAGEPVATSPLLFRRPEPLRARVLLAGDAAGFVDPFVGDGIALALRSGSAAAECLLPFCHGQVTLAAAGLVYRKKYERMFLPVFRNAARLRRLLRLPAPLRAPLVHLLAHTGLPGFIVRRTRGSAVADHPV